MVCFQIARTLPFGGVGHSGQGAYHGKFSFDTFSHKKAYYSTFTGITEPLMKYVKLYAICKSVIHTCYLMALLCIHTCLCLQVLVTFLYQNQTYVTTNIYVAITLMISIHFIILLGLLSNSVTVSLELCKSTVDNLIT